MDCRITSLSRKERNLIKMELRIMKQTGFTLLELIITLVIISILTMIAVPSYQQYVIKARLTEAFNNLSTYQVQMEQAYQDNANYGTASCNVTLPTSKYFTYSCLPSNNGQNYTVTATGNGAGGVSGYVFTINDAGNKNTRMFANNTVSAACWLIQVGDC